MEKVPGPVKILIADDDRDMTDLLREILAKEGYSVSTVHDGQAAIDLYRTLQPDLMILDVAMPLKDGLEVCQEVRRRDKRVLILMLTGQKAQVNTVAGLKAGADGYMAKPCGAKELVARVRSLLRRL